MTVTSAAPVAATPKKFESRPCNFTLERLMLADWRCSRKVVVDPETGCWIWVGARTEAGYGTVTRGKRPRKAYRYVFELLVGPIPDGLHLDHLCRVPACVNPEHLEPVTPAENTRRALAITDDRCHNGHEFNEENTYVYIWPKTGQTKRICRPCRRDYMAGRRTDEVRRKREPSIIECGTPWGYYRHRWERTKPCRACRAAINEYVKSRKAKSPNRRPPVECGSRWGYYRHRREGTTACAACKASISEYVLSRYHARKAVTS